LANPRVPGKNPEINSARRNERKVPALSRPEQIEGGAIHRKYWLKSPVSYFGNWRGFDFGDGMFGDGMFALFENDRQIGRAFPSGKQVWKAALTEGL
jgi:hypothetical protein